MTPNVMDIMILKVMDIMTSNVMDNMFPNVMDIMTPDRFHDYHDQRQEKTWFLTSWISWVLTSWISWLPWPETWQQKSWISWQRNHCYDDNRIMNIMTRYVMDMMTLLSKGAWTTTTSLTIFKLLGPVRSSHGQKDGEHDVILCKHSRCFNTFCAISINN